MKTKQLPPFPIIPLKNIPTIMVGDDPQAKEITRQAASVIMRANRHYRSALRIDGKLSKAKTYAVNYFTTTATIRIS